ncbi:type IIL restriction-modification enzyme MmeI [Bifidobacterium aquikefiricola]|uniref:MmeI-like N-terminal domain-containing protein n=2 Tax=Bifidobacterium TaxID=1678 RepID=A0AB39U7P9_9BIFI
MNIREQKAHDFANRWKNHGDEKQETQKFWMDLLQNMLGRPHALEETEFEHPTALVGYIDVLSLNARFLAEQRQGTAVMPVEQALRYANYLPADEKPRAIGDVIRRVGFCPTLPSLMPDPCS